MVTRPIEEWLTEFVNTQHFQCAIEGEISALDKPQDRLRVRLELLSYLMPKVKGVDAPPADFADKEIKVTYVESKLPKKSKNEKTD